MSDVSYITVTSLWRHGHLAKQAAIR